MSQTSPKKPCTFSLSDKCEDEWMKTMSWRVFELKLSVIAILRLLVVAATSTILLVRCYSIETIDMYMYRQAEIKAISIGKITRLLKQNAIDCLLNQNQQDFSKLDKIEYLTLSNQTKIEINLRDKPFTNICDYQNKKSWFQIQSAFFIRFFSDDLCMFEIELKTD